MRAITSPFIMKSIQFLLRVGVIRRDEEVVNALAGEADVMKCVLAAEGK